jgi:hypothetical protein
VPSLLPVETCVLSLTNCCMAAFDNYDLFEGCSMEICLMVMPSVVWRLFAGFVYLARLLILFQGAYSLCLFKGVCSLSLVCTCLYILTCWFPALFHF